MSTHAVEIKDVDNAVTLRVTAEYSPGRPGIHTLPNGDPGYPDDPAEFWIEQVELKEGKGWVDITAALIACGFDPEDFDTPLAAAVFKQIEESLQSDPPEAEDDWDYPDETRYPL